MYIHSSIGFQAFKDFQSKCPKLDLVNFAIWLSLPGFNSTVQR